MKKVRSIVAIFLLMLTSTQISSEFRLDYYYDQSGMYTKFSDWIPKRLHQWHPTHVEDFFLLYSLKNLYGEQELLRNIHLLNVGLESRFRHPTEALCQIDTPEQYHKYRLLMFMHMHLKIMRSYLRLGSLFDKRHLRFYDLQFADDLKKSFETAEYYYKRAIPFWEEARRLALEADQYKFEIDMGTLESIRYEIKTGEIDFTRIIDKHLNSLQQKKKTVEDFLAQNQQGP